MNLQLLQEMLQLIKQQHMNTDEIDRIALSNLQRQVSRAWTHTDYYRDRFSAAGFQPDALKSLTDIQQLPLTTKADLQAAGDRAISSDIDRSGLIWLKTSGSSGSPMSFPFTRRDKARRVLKELRALLANGYRPTDLMMIFVEPRCLVEEKNMLQRIGLLRRRYVSIFAGDDRQIAQINSLRPQVIYGYTSTLRLLAEKILDGSGLASGPKILVSAAELMEPASRRLLTDAFGVEPVDFYGSTEFGWIAWQCPERHGYHINSDCLILESLKDGKPAPVGVEGELVVTSLYSDAMPLIRYATGDMGTLSRDTCSCGSNLPLLSSVNGRLADCLTLRDGQKLSPYSVTCAVEDVPGVHQYQIVQERDGAIRILLLSGDEAVNPGQLRTAVENALPGFARVLIERVDNLLLEPNGKFKVVKSSADKAPGIPRQTHLRVSG